MTTASLCNCESDSEPVHAETTCLPDTKELKRGLLRKWWTFFTCCVLIALVGLGGSVWLIASQGVGVLGVNNQVPWGWDIVHFVFWIGIGHAGTLISAVLLLARQQWRTPIARGAEMMTLSAVICAAIYPMVHVGRMAMAWLVNPFPDPTDVWLDPASPLVWDVLAVSTYFILSLLFCYLGTIPELARLRDQGSTSWRSNFATVLSLGWCGSLAQWVNYRRVCFFFALILTPLVVSVHSVVSLDFAVTQQHGWHESVFPPYFVAGAVLSGMAMVQLLLVVMKTWVKPNGIESLTPMVIDRTSRFILAFSWIMAFMYLWEALGVMGSTGNEPGGAWSKYGTPTGLAMLIGNLLLPQIYWLKRCRCSSWANVVVGIGVLVGMWAERWVIVVRSLEQTLLGAGDLPYRPTLVDGAMAVGSLALFVALIMAQTALIPFFSGRDNVQTTSGKIPPGRVAFIFRQDHDYQRAMASLERARVDLHQIIASSPMLSGENRYCQLCRWGITGGTLGATLSIAWILSTQFGSFRHLSQGRSASAELLLGWIPGVFEASILGAGLFLFLGWLRVSRLSLTSKTVDEMQKLPANSFSVDEEMTDSVEKVLKGGDIDFQLMRGEALK